MSTLGFLFTDDSLTYGNTVHVDVVKRMTDEVNLAVVSNGVTVLRQCVQQLVATTGQFLERGGKGGVNYTIRV